jgi:hypothetical protein
VDYGIDPTARYGIDFLTAVAPLGMTSIVTNPPFKLIEQFIAHARELVPCVCMLCRLAFLGVRRGKASSTSFPHQRGKPCPPALSRTSTSVKLDTVNVMKIEEMKNTTALATVRKQNVVDLDGFSGFTNECEGDGDDVNMSSRVIQGIKLKFIDPRWLIDDQDVTGKQLTLIGVRNVVNKWSQDNRPLVTEILQPGQKFPDFKKLNDEAPRTEWRTSFGKETGPWSGQHCLYFIDDNYNP